MLVCEKHLPKPLWEVVCQAHQRTEPGCVKSGHSDRVELAGRCVIGHHLRPLKVREEPEPSAQKLEYPNEVSCFQSLLFS